MHGKQSLTEIDIEESLFQGLLEQIPVARYHSLGAEPESLPDCLKVIDLNFFLRYTADQLNQIVGKAVVIIN